MVKGIEIEELLNWALASVARAEEWVCPIWGWAENASSHPLTSTLLNHMSRAADMACCKEEKGEAKAISLANLVLPQHPKKSFSSKPRSILQVRDLCRSKRGSSTTKDEGVTVDDRWESECVSLQSSWLSLPIQIYFLFLLYNFLFYYY